MNAPDRLAETMAQIDQLERAIRSAQADQHRLIAEARELMRVVEYEPRRSEVDNAEWGDRSFVAALATTLRVHERSASRLMHDAGALAEEFMATAHTWAQGDVSLPHVRLLLDFAGTLPHERCGEFEAAALEKARVMTPPAFRRAMRRLVERFHPVPLTERHDAARAERRLHIEHLDDGMAWVNLLCEAERALAIDAHVRALTLDAAAGDERTRGQRAADCAVALLLGGGGALPDRSFLGHIAATPSLRRGSLGAVRPTVHVTVPVLSLLGHGDEPAILDGYGPISIETAREIAAHAPSFHRLLTHPETGAALSYGSTSYRVPADLAAWLRIRDGVCRFPGCTRPASKSDIDHCVAWQHMQCTDHDNLAHLCRKHHRLKHHSRWRMWQGADGVVRWRSPAGSVHDSLPAQVMRPPPKDAASRIRRADPPPAIGA
jgi:hypothetical protein